MWRKEERLEAFSHLKRCHEAGALGGKGCEQTDPHE